MLAVTARAGVAAAGFFLVSLTAMAYAYHLRLLRLRMKKDSDTQYIQGILRLRRDCVILAGVAAIWMLIELAFVLT
jgi:hypothetical protein